jgi:transcriptional regulator with XRE-family HTH domain
MAGSRHEHNLFHDVFVIGSVIVLRRGPNAVGCRLVGTTDGLQMVAGVARLDGGLLARAREAAGLSQSALAVRIGASSKQRIWHWERGAEQPQPRFVPRIARALKVDPLALLDDDPTRPTISALRLAAGLTCSDVWRRASIAKTTYHRIDRGVGARRTDAAVVKAIARVLGAPEDEVLAAIERARARASGG